MGKVYIDMILGITGAFGCGKSSVLAVFATRNWRTADADRICHRFYAADGPLPGKLAERWGKTILLDSGEVDRGKLAAIVFADPAELDALTALWERSVRATHRFLKPGDIGFFRRIVREEALAAVELFVVRNAAGEFAAFAGVAGEQLEMLFVDPAERGRHYL